MDLYLFHIWTIFKVNLEIITFEKFKKFIIMTDLFLFHIFKLSYLYRFDIQIELH